MQKVSWVLALVIGLVVGFVGRGAVDGVAAKPAPRRVEDTRAVYRVPVEGSPAKGPADALVTIVESSDFQCPFCKRGADTMKALEAAYPGQLRFVFKHNPLPMHPKATPLALIAEGARDLGGDAAFWQMHDQIFELAPEFDDAKIDAAVAALGLDAAKLKESVQTRANASRIQRDQRLVQSLGANGTPAFFINGRKVSGARKLEEFRAIVDEELRKARAMVERGTPAAEVYARIIERGATAPVIAGAPAGAIPGPALPPRVLPTAAPGAVAAAAVERPAGAQALAAALQPQAAAAAQAARPPPPAEYAKVPLRADDPARGAKGAKVTLVLFSDFECPFCARVEPSIATLLQEFPNDLRVVWKHQPLPMHQNAVPAALATEAAREQGKFWELHDKLIANQRDLAPASLSRMAREVGLDAGRIEQAVASRKHLARITEDQQLAGRVGAQATPTMFVNCRKVVGALPVDTLRAVVKEELARADGLLGGKPAGAGFYDAACDAAVQAGQKALAQLPPALTIRADDPAKGKAGAPVTLVVFSDFQCPFCAQVEPTLAQVKSTYGDKVRVVWKHQPLSFHPNALPAALAAEAAREQGKFWEMHDRLFQNQRLLSDDLYDRLAGELGLDLAKFKAARASEKLKARIQEDQAVAQQVGANGTPTMFINGQRIASAAPFDQLKAAIDQQLAMKR